MSGKHLSVAATASAILLLAAFFAWGEATESASELPPGPMQAKATTACTECHDAGIIQQQRLGKAAWTKEVDKMVKWGALVDSADRDAFIDYFSSNFPPDKAPYVAACAKATKNSKALPTQRSMENRTLR